MAIETRVLAALEQDLDTYRLTGTLPAELVNLDAFWASTETS